MSSAKTACSCFDHPKNHYMSESQLQLWLDHYGFVTVLAIALICADSFGGVEIAGRSH